MGKVFRSPIIVFEGHVDHGKTLLLDKIRGSAVQAREAGGITQHIGASYIPLETVKKLAGPLLALMKVELRIPGLLMIDTPGHEAFTNLRRRGGSIANLAVLVIDVRAGFMPQTREAIEILKQFKVPFVVAANKIDIIPGWRDTKKPSFSEAYREQSDYAKKKLDEKVYELVGALSDFGFDSDLFSRVEEFTKKIAIVPCSAKTGEGVIELLVLLSGLSQKFLGDNLLLDSKSPARGSVLEVKEERGLGLTVDVIIYDGVLRVGDTVVIAGVDEPIVTKVKALLEPAPLREIRERAKFKRVSEVRAAAGVKIAAPNLSGVIAGMPFQAVHKEQDVPSVADELQGQVSEVTIKTERLGVGLVADSIGSLEAIVGLLKKAGVEVRSAHIGAVTRRDVIEAATVHEQKEEFGAILCFGLSLPDEVLALAKSNGVKIISSNIIYKLLEDYEAWRAESIERKRETAFSKLVLPGKFRVLPGFVFRQSKPAVVGVEVLVGPLSAGGDLINQGGVRLGKLKSLEEQGKSLSKVAKGEKVAASITGAVVGRNLREGDELITNMDSGNFRKLKDFKEKLSLDQVELLKEIAAIKRKKEPLWGL